MPFDDDAWVRMRAVDTLEKVCRQHSDWLTPYIDRLLDDFSTNTQASIQWHMAQIFSRVCLSGTQKSRVIAWLTQLLSSSQIDWIVAANAMDTLIQFTQNGDYPKVDTAKLLRIQLSHASNAVIKRANKHLAALGN